MRYIHELTDDAGIVRDEAAVAGNCCEEGSGLEGAALVPSPCPFRLGGKNKVNILALGDVGTTMLTGLRLLGDDVISDIGIMDIRRENLERLEMEINQIGYPFGMRELPPVHITDEDHLFECDVLIFCASRGIPPVPPAAAGFCADNAHAGAAFSDGRPDAESPAAAGSGEAPADVRMAQLDANREIIGHYAALARRAGYKGMVAVVSDPVDNLAAAFLGASGLEPCQIEGYGLGVMNMRALYYSKKLKDKISALALYGSEGRAYGPHGQDLVIANSIENYDDEASSILTGYTVNANMRVRELGFKPYIAPALSSAAISILLTLRGEWHYGSVYMGSRSDGAYLGIRNRRTESGICYEDVPLPDALYERILSAYENLCRVR